MSKRSARKKKRQRARLIRLLGLFLVAVAAVTGALILLLRPDPEEAAPLAGDALWDGGWYADDLGLIPNDRALVRGMKAFEKRAGTRPYLSLLSGVEPKELDLFAREQYEALFTEGDHLLVVYDEWEEGTYYLAAEAGAESALTDEDVSRLLTAIEKAYADPANETYADAFGAGFAQGAKAVSAREGRYSIGVTVLLVLGIILLVLGAILVVFLRKRRRAFTRWASEDPEGYIGENS